MKAVLVIVNLCPDTEPEVLDRDGTDLAARELIFESSSVEERCPRIVGHRMSEAGLTIKNC